MKISGAGEEGGGQFRFGEGGTKVGRGWMAQSARFKLGRIKKLNSSLSKCMIHNHFQSGLRMTFTMAKFNESFEPPVDIQN